MSDKKVFTIELPDNLSPEESKALLEKLKSKFNLTVIEEDETVHIWAILDRSGSMQSIIQDSIGGFNTFLKNQQDVKVGKAVMNIHLFDDKHEELVSLKPIEAVEPLTDKTYVPRGSTALLDAIGITLNKAFKKGAKNNIILILTDGQENASSEYTNEQIKKMIKQAEEKNMEIVYLAANQDAFAVSRGLLGMTKGAAVNFAASAAGTQAAYADFNVATTRYRSSVADKNTI
jgi:hypothetical protein